MAVPEIHGWLAAQMWSVLLTPANPCNSTLGPRSTVSSVRVTANARLCTGAQKGVRMNAQVVIRIWKDEDFRASLAPGQESLMPQNPANHIMLLDSDLLGGSEPITTSPWCMPTTTTIGPLGFRSRVSQ